MRAILPLEQRAGCDRDVRRVLRQEVFEDDDELIGAPVGKRREQHGIHDREQRRRRCDGDGEHHRGERRQAARAAQHTHAVPDVLQHFFEGQPAALVAPCLLRMIDAPELAVRGRVRGGTIESAGLEAPRQFLDVKSQLVVQLRVAPPAPADRDQAHHPFAHGPLLFVGAQDPIDDPGGPHPILGFLLQLARVRILRKGTERVKSGA